MFRFVIVIRKFKLYIININLQIIYSEYLLEKKYILLLKGTRKKKCDTKFLIQFLRELWMKNSIRKSIYFYTLYFYTNHSWKYIILLVSAFLILYLSIVINSLILVTNHYVFICKSNKTVYMLWLFFFELLRKIN